MSSSESGTGASASASGSGASGSGSGSGSGGGKVIADRDDAASPTTAFGAVESDSGAADDVATTTAVAAPSVGTKRKTAPTPTGPAAAATLAPAAPAPVNGAAGAAGVVVVAGAPAAPAPVAAPVAVAAPAVPAPEIWLNHRQRFQMDAFCNRLTSWHPLPEIAALAADVQSQVLTDAQQVFGLMDGELGFTRNGVADRNLPPARPAPNHVDQARGNHRDTRSSLTFSYGAALTYGTKKYAAAGVPPCIAQLQAVVQRITHRRFDLVLVNLYTAAFGDKGDRTIDWHTDTANYKQTRGPERTVACVTFGQAREMWWHPYRKTAPKTAPAFQFTPQPASLWLMDGCINPRYIHCVPRPANPAWHAAFRVSLSFRQTPELEAAEQKQKARATKPKTAKATAATAATAAVAAANAAVVAAVAAVDRKQPELSTVSAASLATATVTAATASASISSSNSSSASVSGSGAVTSATASASGEASPQKKPRI